VKVIIYRPSADAKDACAVVQLGVPEWAIEEFLAQAALDRGFDEDPEEWRDPEDRTLLWNAVAFSEGQAVGLPRERVSSDSPIYHDHTHGAVAVAIRRWSLEEPVSAILGAGWWRFLSDLGEQRLLSGWSSEGDVKAPSLVLRLKSKRFLITDADGNLRIMRGERDAQIQLLDRGTLEPLASAVFSQETPIDQVVCQLLQQLSQLLRIVGVAVSRKPVPPDPAGQGASPEFRLALLFTDTEPDPDAEPPEGTGGANI
jgi:hypothetical protein